MVIDWNQMVIPAAPDPDPVPNLSRWQFEWLIATRTAAGNYLEDVLETVLGALKVGIPGTEVPANPEGYRLLKSRLAGETFVFADTVEMVQTFTPYLEALFPGEEITGPVLRAIWDEALAQ